MAKLKGDAMKDLERLKKAMLEARWYRDNIWQKRESERERSVAEATERIDAELSAKYGDEYHRLCKAYTEAFDAYEAAIIENAHATLPYPIGTKMIGWAKEKLSRFRTVDHYSPMATGVIEVFVSGSEVPANTRYHLPAIGDVVVRIHKKDGSLGKNVEMLFDSWGNKYKWLPEGEKPSP